MDERLRRHHVLSWSAVGVAAAMLVVACFVPSLEILISAGIGAGFEARGFSYERELALASFDVGWPGPLAVVAGLALVAAAVAGIVVGSRPWLVVASFAVAVALGLLAFDTEDQRLSWAGPGVVGYESPHGGPLLQPALDELKAEARASSEARNPGWQLAGVHAFSSRGLTAWRVFLWSTLALLWLTGYRLSRLALRPVASVSLVAVATAAFFVWFGFHTLTRSPHGG